MKTTLTVIILLILLSSNIKSQITITSDDVTSYYTVGTTYLSNYDTLAAHIYIGEKGMFTMSFEGHQFNQTSASTSVTTASTGYAAAFPNAQFALKSSQTNSEGAVDSWTFYSLSSTDLLFHGQASKISVSGFDMETISKFSPVESVFKVPLNYMDTWTSDYIDSSKTTFGGFETGTSVIHFSAVHTADGYGTITTPDNRTIEVLRIKQDLRSFSGTGGYLRSINYSYISKTGESFSLTASDTTEAETGIINVIGLSWQTRGTTGVNDDIASVNGYKLFNNYPNPFNPSTKITYNVPAASRINIKVVNLLGETVRDIYETAETPGIHEFNFNASELSSGTYIYTLSAHSLNGDNSSYTSSGKMMLIK